MILAGTLSALVLAPGAEAYPGAPWFRPSVVYTGNFPDPSVVVVGRSYVAYATTTGGAYLPAETSTDLVHWTAQPSYDPEPQKTPSHDGDGLTSSTTSATSTSLEPSHRRPVLCPAG